MAKAEAKKAGGPARLLVAVVVLGALAFAASRFLGAPRWTIEVVNATPGPLFELSVLEGGEAVRSVKLPAGETYAYAVEGPVATPRRVRFRQHEGDDPEEVEVQFPGGIGPPVGHYRVTVREGGVRTEVARDWGK